MRSLKLIAAAALVSTTMVAPAFAYCDANGCYRRGPAGAAADTAAGVAGAAVGTAAGVATAPLRDSYAYDRERRRSEYACEPGTWFRGPDGRRHPCQ
jgi:hypothetical protein